MSELRVEVVDLTRLAVDPAEVARLAARVLSAEGVRDGELGVRFVGARRMRALNRDHLGHDEVTDVLSFPLEEGDEIEAGGAPGGRRAGADDDPGAWAAAAGDGSPVTGDDSPDHMPRLLGDVVVCPLRAAAQARAAGRPLALEIAALLVHGTLHVVGYDHETDAGEMAAREARLLDEVDWEHLLGPA
jgi:probable rRNA maturation factor